MSLAEMRAELRELRKEHVKPVSRMRKSDISAEIQKMKVHREETAAPAATPAPAPKKMASSVESIKEAKKHEFPRHPEGAEKKKMTKKTEEKKAPMSKKEKLKKMLAEMSDDE
jgi:hypothetical protein